MESTAQTESSAPPNEVMARQEVELMFRALEAGFDLVVQETQKHFGVPLGYIAAIRSAKSGKGFAGVISNGAEEDVTTQLPALLRKLADEIASGRGKTLEV